MDGVERERRRRSFKERLGFKVMGCCGTTWGFGSTTMSVREDDDVEVEEQEQQQERVEATNAGHNPDPGCLNPDPVSSGMNLAAALAAERHFRASQEPEGGNNVGSTSNGTENVGIRSPGTPLRVTLMRLLEEVDGGGGEEVEGKGGVEMGNDSMCCVCMGRKKGAAFIPCGHTFCRFSVFPLPSLMIIMMMLMVNGVINTDHDDDGDGNGNGASRS
ncbi:hypothetical protein CRYUN_Cryun31cG0008200 [Craigia yunnanensis]